MFIITTQKGKKYIVLAENVASAYQKLKKRIKLEEIVSTLEVFDYEILS